MPSQLPPVESYNSRKLCSNEGVTYLVEDLFPIQVPTENLFDIQINEIDVDLNRFNELPSMKGNTTNTLNEYFDSAQKQNAHHNTKSTCKPIESPIMDFTHTAPKISTSQYTRNPTLMSIKRNWKKQTRTRGTGSKTVSKLLCVKRGCIDHLELPKKRRMVSKEDESSSNLMVVAMHRPRQSP